MKIMSSQRVVLLNGKSFEEVVGWEEGASWERKGDAVEGKGDAQWQMESSGWEVILSYNIWSMFYLLDNYISNRCLLITF